jgi:hypothetical protein
LLPADETPWMGVGSPVNLIGKRRGEMQRHTQKTRRDVRRRRVELNPCVSSNQCRGYASATSDFTTDSQTLASSVFDDLEDVALLFFATRCGHQCSNRRRMRPALSNHFPQVFFCNPKFKDVGVITYDFFDLNLIRLINQRSHNVFKDLPHGLSSQLQKDLPRLNVTRSCVDPQSSLSARNGTCRLALTVPSSRGHHRHTIDPIYNNYRRRPIPAPRGHPRINGWV